MSERKLRLVVTGGGTGGHVLPAVAVIEELRRRAMLEDLLWIGSHTGQEQATAAAAGIEFRAVQTGKLRRYFSLQTVSDAGKIPVGVVQARRHVSRFRPTVVFSTGGFVSVPTVIAARGRAPVLTHEQTAILGLATRINARLADALAVSYESTADAARKVHRNVVVCGNPVRSFLSGGDPERGRAHWQFSRLPFIYITGGSLGASPINQRVAALLPELLNHAQVLHQAGAASSNRDAAELTRLRATWPPEIQQRYHVVERVGDELPDVYAAADLVIGRAGAGTVSELAYLGKPSILIPLPGTGGDEQTRNAQVLASAGAAVVLQQAQATPERLRSEILRLINDHALLAQMSAAARSVGRADAAARLADALIALSRH